MVIDEKTYGQIAFEAYCENRKNTTYDDKPIPNWDELKPEIKVAWEVSAIKVIHNYCKNQGIELSKRVL